MALKVENSFKAQADLTSRIVCKTCVQRMKISRSFMAGDENLVSV